MRIDSELAEGANLIKFVKKYGDKKRRSKNKTRRV